MIRRIRIVLIYVGTAFFVVSLSEAATVSTYQLETNNALVLDYVTPHTKWAKPYAGGSIRVLYIAALNSNVNVGPTRAAVELIRDIGGEIRTEPQTGVTAYLISHVTDPWGGRFELLEDPVYTGINHIHLFASDADAMSDWFLEVFGGEYDEERGQGNFHTILYGSVWVHITQVADDDQRAPSRYRATDHIGFRVPSLDAFRLKLMASGYEPYLERPNPPRADLMFFEGPEGLHVEMTEPAPR